MLIQLFQKVHRKFAEVGDLDNIWDVVLYDKQMSHCQYWAGQATIQGGHRGPFGSLIYSLTCSLKGPMSINHITK